MLLLRRRLFCFHCIEYPADTTTPKSPPYRKGLQMHIFDLPAELRGLIFEYALTFDHALAFECRHVYANAEWTTLIYKRQRLYKPERPSWALIFANRQVYGESAHLVTALNHVEILDYASLRTFHVHYNSIRELQHPTTQFQALIRRSMSLLPVNHCEMMTTATFTFDRGHAEYDNLISILPAFEALEKLRLVAYLRFLRCGMYTAESRSLGTTPFSPAFDGPCTIIVLPYIRQAAKVPMTSVNYSRRHSSVRVSYH